MEKGDIIMPLDFVTNPLFDLEGTDLDFKIEYSPTKMQGKKYVHNSVTGDVIGIVGSKFKAANHIDFFNGIKKATQDNRLPHELEGAVVKIQTARNKAFALLDIKLPNVEFTITTSKHQTKINERLVALHGVDGSCSNQVYTGGIDFYCTNGLITGSYESIKRKNTSGFVLAAYINEVKQARLTFDESCNRLQKWADTPLNVDGKTFLASIIKSETLAKKMYALACEEISKRGKNVFALYSAFTNYASYADERNGFKIRDTGFDTQTETMWKREQQVAKWISTPQFQSLLAA